MVDSESNEEQYTHCWLLIDDNIYVDITADQFNGKNYFKKYEPISSCIVAVRDTKLVYDCFKNSKMRYIPNVGINSYGGDIPDKLKIIYDLAIIQIENGF